MKQHYIIHKSFLLTMLSILLILPGLYAQFTPGEGGTLPTFTQFTQPEGKFGGLFLKYSHRQNGLFVGSGTYAEVDMEFPTPSAIGANSYTVQISANNGQSWSNYQHNYEDLVLTGDNFSLSPDGSYTFRLLANGGPKNGFTSNEVLASLSGIETRFAGWSLDESMFLTGIMAPNIGRGLEAGFTVRKLSDDSDVTGHLTYQWFRVNPLTSEMTVIDGATGLTYATTNADAGYKLAIRATGDETEVGGMAQILSSWPNQITNNAYASNVDQTGFNLYLHKGLTALTAAELELTDVDANVVPITNVQTIDNNASFRISAALDPAKTPFHLVNKSDFWQIVTQMEGMHMSMPGVNIDFGTGLSKTDLKTVFTLKNNCLTFNSTEIIDKISITDLSGRLICEAFPGANAGIISTRSLLQSAYIIQYQINNIVHSQKIISE